MVLIHDAIEQIIETPIGKLGVESVFVEAGKTLGGRDVGVHSGERK